VGVSFHALICGSLTADPQKRTTKDCRHYVTVSVRIEDQKASTVLSAIGFGEYADSLSQFVKGDSVAIGGPARLTEWTARDGTVSRGVSVTAYQIASTKPERLKRVDAERKQRQRRPRLSLPQRAPCGPALADDDISDLFRDQGAQ
jgi:single-stranded DNA-binding protein